MMSSPRRPSLSTTQVAASVLATLTGAIAASYLGVASTLYGAAVGSIASTVGTEVYRHYLRRTEERLRGAVVARRAGHTAAGPTDAATGQKRVGVGRREAGGSDTAETVILPAQHPGGTAWGTGTGSGTSSRNDPIHDSPTETLSSAANRSEGVSAAIPAGEGAAGGKRGRPRWLMPTAITAGAFVAAVLAITLLELGVGKPLDSLLWNRHNTGTTVGGAVGGQKTQPTPTPTPTASASPSTLPTSPSPSAVVSSTPTPTAPAVTPSASVSPSPGGPENPAPTATSSP